MTKLPADKHDREYMTVEDLAADFQTSTAFWNDLRSQGGGPVYLKLSGKAVRYRKSDVDKWLAERRRMSTREGALAA